MRTGIDLIWLDLALIAIGGYLTATLVRRRSWHVATAVVGTLLAVVATLAGFSIGVYIAPIAAILLTLSALGMRSNGRVTPK